MGFGNRVWCEPAEPKVREPKVRPLKALGSCPIKQEVSGRLDSKTHSFVRLKRAKKN